MARARHISTACVALLAPAQSPAISANWRRQYRDAVESAPDAFRDGVADTRSNGSAGQPAGGPGTDRHVAGSPARVRTCIGGRLDCTVRRGWPADRTVLARRAAVDPAHLRGRAGGV